ncbi:MAG: DUF167 domain-containing protein [Acidobacteriota bacterium]|nr:DUF167 domain-containing protein [Acidobacteriota bacterium]
MIQFTEKNGALIFTVRAVPRASKSEIVGSLDGALKIRLASPPVDGAANLELVKILSKTLGVPGNAIEILSGRTARTKQVKISGISPEDFLKLIRGSAEI